ncbi:MAG: CpsD/CapB family tyrosine-protein kinase [Ignavibacteriae bacterium]|nr:CpsD/CapB family tyrosine-protein kinase [Ignavibacteriota bacterium]
MADDANISMLNNEKKIDGTSDTSHHEDKLVRLIKSIVINHDVPEFIDETVIKFKYYNSFNFSPLAQDHKNFNLTLGITSPNAGEGKTLVACNLAIALVLGSQKKTVLVDLNVTNPCLHRIFGTQSQPGLVDAFMNSHVDVYRTRIEHLCVLPIGDFTIHQTAWLKSSPVPTHQDGKPTIGLEQLATFRDVIYSLQQEFEFVIVDMPSIQNGSVPLLFANQLDGLIIVVESGRTKREDIDALLHQINQHQILGFVFNRFNERIS